ncbi:MAG: hypothetical protein LBR85_08510 [Oscillospiraceae bacterium]|jgi:DNA-directed RNA polymerase subunit RPC12/RpoP|nr:hypothetical protein [Oscillospiraceae bacterium]
MDTTTYKCPSCGAALEFSIEKQQWACDFCGNVFSLGDLVGGEAERSEHVHEDAGVFGGEVTGFRCQSCGAEIIAEKNTAATFCAYCRSPAIIPSQLGEVRKPNYILPFKISKDNAIEIMLNKCKRRPLLPLAFRRDIRQGVISGLYVPFWLFSCDARGFIEAEGDIITRWSDSHFRYTKIDTFLIVRDTDMHVSRVPIDASDKMDDAMMHAIEPYDYGHLEPFAMQYLSGHYANSYDMTPNEAIPIGDMRMDRAVVNVVEGMARKGYTVFRRRRLDIYKRNTVMHYAMMPVWTFVGKFREKDYVFSINGQTGKVSGKLPVSPGRVAAWLSGAFVVFTGLAFALSLVL